MLNTLTKAFESTLLTNSTTLPVYFKVVDDDASNPRFVLGETSGGVKVY